MSIDFTPGIINTYHGDIYNCTTNTDNVKTPDTPKWPCDNWEEQQPINSIFSGEGYNPEQFEIIGMLQSSTDEQAGIPNLRFYNSFREMRQDMSYTGASGGKANGNPVIKEKPKKGNFLYNEKTGEYVHSVYARIVIRRKL